MRSQRNRGHPKDRDPNVNLVYGLTQASTTDATGTRAR